MNRLMANTTTSPQGRPKKTTEYEPSSADAMRGPSGDWAASKDASEKSSAPAGIRLRILKPVVLEMSPEEYERAVDALSAMLMQETQDIDLSQSETA